MKISVSYKEREDACPVAREYELSRLAFVTHLAKAGRGKISLWKESSSCLKSLRRAIGMFLHYYDFIQRDDFNNNNRFSLPHKDFLDPTEQGQFSNVAGLAIADFLSKRIDNASYTEIYEVAVRTGNKGKLNKEKRPDLIAFAPQDNKMVAIEAKGYAKSKCADKDMPNAKQQAQSGLVTVNSCVACVSYNIYKKIECNYWDPTNRSVRFDDELFKILTRQYYKGLAEFLDEKYFYHKFKDYGGEKFLEIGIKPETTGRIFQLLQYYKNCQYEVLEKYQPRLIIPADVKEFAEKGLPENFKPFDMKSVKTDAGDEIYIDNDYVGLKITHSENKYSINDSNHRCRHRCQRRIDIEY